LPPDPVLAHILTSPTPPPPALEPRSSELPMPSAPAPAHDPEQRPELEAQPEDEGRPSTLVDEAEAQAAQEAPEMEAPSSERPRPQAITSLPMPPLSSPPGSIPPSAAPPVPSSMAPATEGVAAVMGPPSDRDSLLAKLRQRAASLTEEQMAAILRRS
jgi:hypothetical protein